MDEDFPSASSRRLDVLTFKDASSHSHLTRRESFRKKLSAECDKEVTVPESRRVCSPIATSATHITLIIVVVVRISWLGGAAFSRHAFQEWTLLNWTHASSELELRTHIESPPVRFEPADVGTYCMLFVVFTKRIGEEPHIR